MSTTEWPRLEPAVRNKRDSEPGTDPPGLQEAEAIDVHRAKTPKEAEFRAQVAASTATGDECRSVEEFTSAQIAHLERRVSVLSNFRQLIVHCSTSLS